MVADPAKNIFELFQYGSVPPGFNHFIVLLSREVITGGCVISMDVLMWKDMFDRVFVDYF